MSFLEKIDKPEDVLSGLKKLTEVVLNLDGEDFLLCEEWDFDDADPIEQLFLKAIEFKMYEEIKDYLTVFFKYTDSIESSYIELWYDEEHPMGCFAAEALANYDVNNIKYYIKFLQVCDLDHEVHQSDFIKNLVCKYSLVPEIYDLLKARATNCWGQHGEEDLAYIEEQFQFSNWLLAEGLVEDFIDRLFTGHITEEVIDPKVKDFYVDELDSFLLGKEKVISLRVLESMIETVFGRSQNLTCYLNNVYEKYKSLSRTLMMTSLEDYRTKEKHIFYLAEQGKSTDWQSFEVKDNITVFTYDICVKGALKGNMTSATLEFKYTGYNEDEHKTEIAIAKADDKYGRNHNGFMIKEGILSFRLNVDYSGSENDYCSLAFISRGEKCTMKL